MALCLVGATDEMMRQFLETQKQSEDPFTKDLIKITANIVETFQISTTVRQAEVNQV